MVKVLAWPAFKNRLVQPYNWLLYTPMKKQMATIAEFSWNRLLRGGYDVFHLHWPDAMFNSGKVYHVLVKMVLMLVLIDFSRLRGTKVVWTVHNLQSHEGLYPRMEGWFWRRFASRIDGFISLSEVGKKAVEERLPALGRVPGFIVPLGHYRDVYPNQSTRAQARSHLGIDGDSPVLLFLGLIRPYKNVTHLVQIVRQMADPNVVLIVVGKPNTPELKAEVEAVANGDPRVTLLLDFAPDEMIHFYMNAADLIVLPYKEVLNSSAAMLALSFNRPVLVPEKGALAELSATVGKAWVKTYKESLSVDLLSQALFWARNEPRLSGPNLDHLSWERLSLDTLEAYREVKRR